MQDRLIEKATVYRNADHVEELKRIAMEADASRLVEDLKLNKAALERLRTA